MTAPGHPTTTTLALFGRFAEVELAERFTMRADHAPLRELARFAGAITWRRWVRLRLGPCPPEDFAHDAMALLDRVAPVLPIVVPFTASPSMRALATEGLMAAFARARHPQSATPT